MILFLLLPLLLAQISLGDPLLAERKCTKALDFSTCGACPLLVKTRCIFGKAFKTCIEGTQCGSCKADSGSDPCAF